MDKRLSIFWKNLWIVLAIAFSAPVAVAAAQDPLMGDQWALSNPAAIGAQEAWTQSSGAGVLVAVLDTGVQLDHPDLAGNIWTNPGEIAGNGRDDDSNGIVDDVHGANMFDRSANAGDDHGHGTHVAGIIAARQGNAIGGSGLAPAAKILPVKVLDSSMSGTTDTLAAGIRYAVDGGARILNVSLNSDTATEPMKAAVRYAGERGAIIVASAGNNARNIDLLPSYPASLSDPAILSVAAATDGGVLWNLSNSGLKSVDLAAPGQYIASTMRGSSYQSRSGTSAAAPFVAASIALLAEARPDLPMGALRDALLATTRRTDLLAALLGAGGRLDVGAAMHRVLAGRPWKSAAPQSSAAVAGPTLLLRAKSKARVGSKLTLRWSATGADSVTTWRVSLNGKVVKTVSTSKNAVTRRIARAGRHKWRVVGFDAGGAKVVAARRAFQAVPRR